MLVKRYRIGFELLTLVVAALLLQGCALYRVQNNPVEGMTDPLQGYRLMHPQRDYGDVLLLMSFSGGGTLADIFHHDRPYIEINATDLSSGQRFSFTQR